MPDSAEQKIINCLATAPSIHPSGAKLFVPDWTLDPGDVITVKSGEEEYAVPIYSMNLNWNGVSTLEVESTGNQKRNPLSALNEKKMSEYNSRRFGYGLSKQVEEQTQQQYEHYVDQTDAYRKEIYRINGVEYDAKGKVKYVQATDAQGNPIWETDEQGNYILDEDGNKIPVYALDNVGNKIPVYNPESNGSISGQVIQSAQRMATIIKQSGTVYEVFSETKQYYEGDRVLYPDSNGNPYKFINDHNPGPWKGDGEHGDVEALGTLQSQIDHNTENFNVIYGDVIEIGGKVDTVIGSTLWGNREQLVAINGKIRVNSQTGAVYIESGGGLYTERTSSGGTTVTSGIWDEGNLTAGAIVSKINNQASGQGQTVYRITADKIILDGTATATTLDARLLNVDNLFASTGYSGCIYLGSNDNGTSISATGAINGLSVSGGTVTAGTLQLIADNEGNTETYTGKTVKIANSTVQNLWLLGTGSASSLDIPDAVTDVQISGPTNNVYTLQKKTLSNNSWQDCNVTFSRATSLNGTWSGSTYNIAATPQGNNWSIDFNAQSSSDATWATELGTGTVNSRNEKWLDFPLYIGSYNPSGPITHNVTINKSIDASAVWQKGFEAGESGGGGGNRTVQSIYPDTITLDGEETEMSEHVLNAYYTSGTDTTPVTVKVDASAVFSAGVTQGMGGTTVDVVKNDWVTSISNMNLMCRFSPSAGDGEEKSVLIKQSPVRNLSSSTGTVNLTDYDEIIGSVTLDMTRSGNQVILRHLKNPIVTPSTIIAGTPIAVLDVSSSGPTIVSDVDKIVQIGNIEYSSDYKTAIIAVQAQDSSSHELLTDNITTSVESAWEAGRTVGISEGSGLKIEDNHYELITDNKTTVNVFPTRPNIVMTSASIRVEVPVNEGIQGAMLLASVDSKTIYNDWQLDDDTELSEKYGFIQITGKDGSTYSYGIDASKVYRQGMIDGSGGFTGFSYEGTAIGNVQTDHEYGNITVSALNGSTVLDSDTLSVYLTQGQWNSSNRKAVNIRMADGSNTLIARTWVDAPTVSYDTPSISCTNWSGGSPTASKTITVANNSTGFITVTATANGKTSPGYIIVIKHS